MLVTASRLNLADVRIISRRPFHLAGGGAKEVNAHERDSFPAHAWHVDGSDDAHHARLKKNDRVAAVVAVITFDSFLHPHLIANVQIRFLHSPPGPHPTPEKIRQCASALRSPRQCCPPDDPGHLE